MFTSTTIPLPQLSKDTYSLITTPRILSQNKTISDSKEHFWKLISFIPIKAFISDTNKALSVYLFKLARMLIILSIMPAFLIAYAVTKKRYKQQQLYRMANFDKLTNLPNRKLFFESLNRAVKQAVKNKTVFAVLYMDIDNLKK